MPGIFRESVKKQHKSKIICIKTKLLYLGSLLFVMKITSGSRKGMYINRFSEKRGIEFEFLKPRKKEYFIESVVPNVIIRNRTYNIITVRDTK